MIFAPQTGSGARGRGTPGGGWRWLPVLTAVGVWLLLLGVTAGPAFHSQARARLPWMLDPLFHDWHVIRRGWEMTRAGGDALGALDQPYNYPRVVLLGAYAGGLAVPAAVAGLGTAAAFLACVVGLLWPRSAVEAIVAAALVASPPMLLMLERANLDAWVFILVVGGLAWLARAPATRGAVGAGTALLAAAAMMKLYPAIVLLGVAGLWRGARRAMAVVGLAVLAGWVAVSSEEIALILRKTTRGLEPAYGRMLAGSRYYVEVLMPQVAGAGSGRILRELMGWSLVGCLAVFGLAVGVGWWRRSRIAAVMKTDCTGGWFVGGSLIYAGTFLLGSNWSYRLVFLLLCVPALWRAGTVPRARPWAGAALAGVMVMLLAPLHLGLGWFLAGEGVAWLLAVALLGTACGLIAGGCSDNKKAICAPPESK